MRTYLLGKLLTEDAFARKKIQEKINWHTFNSYGN